MKNNSLNMSNQQDSGCKIFVGGLTWNTTKDMLYTEFTKFGEIIDTIVMKNPETGNSRGFGFVTFRDNMSAENAVNSGSHKIDGKIVDVKLCNPRLAAQQRSNKQKTDNCKVFVGGLPHGVTDEDIKQFFSRYGYVKEFKMMYDENKQRPRGFGFITFELEESANQVLQEHYIQFNGKQIEVKPQIHNLKQQMNPHQQHHHQQHHQQQHHHQQQQHHFGNPHQQQYGNVNWNQTWNHTGAASTGQLAAAGNIPAPAAAANNGTWGSYGNANINAAAAAQQWGYTAAPAHHNQAGGLPGAPYANNAAGAGTQSNWNYANFYGQPQPGYYQADTTGTDKEYIDDKLSNKLQQGSANLISHQKIYASKASSIASSVAGTIGTDGSSSASSASSDYTATHANSYSDSDLSSLNSGYYSGNSETDSVHAPSISASSIVSSASVLLRNNRPTTYNNSRASQRVNLAGANNRQQQMPRPNNSIATTADDFSSVYSSNSSTTSFKRRPASSTGGRQHGSSSLSLYHPYR